MAHPRFVRLRCNRSSAQRYNGDQGHREEGQQGSGQRCKRAKCHIYRRCV